MLRSQKWIEHPGTGPVNPPSIDVFPSAGLAVAPSADLESWLFFQFSILLTSEQCQKPFFCCLMINMIKCRGTHYHPLQSGEFPIGCTSIPMIQHDPPSDFREFWEIFGTLFGKSVSSSILQIRQAQSQTLPSWGLWHSTRSSVPGTIRGGCDLFFYLGGSRSSNIE